MEVSITDAFRKIHPTDTVDDQPTVALVGPTGSTVSFQIHFRFPRQQRTPHWPKLDIVLDAEAVDLAAYRVDLVPVRCPIWYPDIYGYQTSEPGLLPDKLVALDLSAGHPLTVAPTHVGWNTVWVDVQLPDNRCTGRVHVRLAEHDTGDTLIDRTIDCRAVEVEKAEVPTSILRWIHTDSVADHYGIEVFGRDYWQAVEQHMRAAASIGTTAVLAPIWSPPLDVEIGSYRTHCQLLGVEKTGDGYSFDFSGVAKWIECSRRAGLTGIEVPHLFSQWGATAAAPIFVDVPALWTAPSTTTPTFGWHTQSNDPEYLDFLKQLLPQLREFLESQVDPDRIWWHMSDEPRQENLESFTNRTGDLVALLDGATIIDAVSDPEFLQVVQTPVVATSEVERFRAADYEPEWVYYCVSQSVGQANQFIAQTAAAHLVQGFQLYKFACAGFLHWGFDFYYSQYSRSTIDPATNTDAGGNFLSGDPFLVYPGPTPASPVTGSLRLAMLRQAFTSLQLCWAAEKKHGREAVIAVIDPAGQLDYAAGFPGPDRYAEIIRALVELAATS
ncbi:DUF4091 domain-containing protein [Corynebacterium mendelii]|uniref:DUF4091 domain-containing protein n=1 Tax=Corynebacterium mendelii TaxID=2765362 RepID=A0A939E1X3_9CORY|nr:DUF4091 domain-containing protein [Corynebacterium mendelii]MBN9644007.1 DUF4091 domain-containing protein [Corynebacterium mendelii]